MFLLVGSDILLGMQQGRLARYAGLKKLRAEVAFL